MYFEKEDNRLSPTDFFNFSKYFVRKIIDLPLSLKTYNNFDDSSLLNIGYHF